MNTGYSILVIAVLAMACARPSQPNPHPRTIEPGPIGRVLAVSDLNFGRSASVRVLSDGRVLLADEDGSHLWMLDQNLRNPRLIGDDTPLTGRLMDVRGSWVNPYLGDSTMLIKSGRGDIVILDEQGRPARKLYFRFPPGAGPQRPTAEWTSDMIRGVFTKRGDLMVLSEGRRPRGDTTRLQPIYVVRTSFVDPQRRDTVGRMVRQQTRWDTTMRNGSFASWITTGDAAGMFPDGTIAIVRTKTYTVELIDPRGERREVAIPHDWTVLTAADKQAAMDSLYASVRTPSLVLEARTSSGTLIGSSANGPARVVSRLSDITDTVPPIGPFNQVFADASGQLWIQKIVVRTNPYRWTSDNLYDVIDSKGKLVRRVAMPPDWQIKAFLPGVVYYTAMERGRVRLFMARSR